MKRIPNQDKMPWLVPTGPKQLTKNGSSMEINGKTATGSSETYFTFGSPYIYAPS